MLFFQSQHGQLHASPWRSFGRREEARNGGRRQDRPWTASFCAQPCGRARGSWSFRAPSPLRSARGGRDIFQHTIKNLVPVMNPRQHGAAFRPPRLLLRVCRGHLERISDWMLRLDVVWIWFGFTVVSQAQKNRTFSTNGSRTMVKESRKHIPKSSMRVVAKNTVFMRTRGMIVRLPCHGNAAWRSLMILRGERGRVCEVSVTIKPNIFLLASFS